MFLSLHEGLPHSGRPSLKGKLGTGNYLSYSRLFFLSCANASTSSREFCIKLKMRTLGKDFVNQRDESVVHGHITRVHYRPTVECMNEKILEIGAFPSKSQELN